MPQNAAAPLGYTFAVDAAPDVGRRPRGRGSSAATPTSDERVPNRNYVEFAGLPSSVFDRDPAIQVRYVHESWGTATAWAAVTPRAGSAPYQVQASWGVQACVGGSDLLPVGDSSADTAGGKAAIAFGNARTRLLRLRRSGRCRIPPDTWSVPVGAVRVDGITVSVDWSAQGWGLSPATATFSASCEPNNPPPAT